MLQGNGNQPPECTQQTIQKEDTDLVFLSRASNHAGAARGTNRGDVHLALSMLI